MNYQSGFYKQQQRPLISQEGVVPRAVERSNQFIEDLMKISSLGEICGLNL